MHVIFALQALKDHLLQNHPVLDGENTLIITDHAHLFSS